MTRRLSIFKTAGLALALFQALPAFAGSRDLWRSDTSLGHYFLRDNATGKFVETIDCRVAFTFDVVADGNDVRLYDRSRDMYVELQNGLMWLKQGSNDWTKYRDGRFDSRITYNHEDASGAVSGAIWKKNGCRWEEYLDGTANPSFRFVEQRADGAGVQLYDAGRNLYVFLTGGAMYLRTGTGVPFKLFKKGGWY
jgi:hypothetical protein